ncbi:DUF1467 family protein [Salmonella enterica subsp. enterica]|nr:DUF1467 family protein [Salmonella enterica subsp. enterica]EBU8131961.1 DUF1467 domain-containing protein [Salmonella enterica subsp. enterica serovar Java]EBW2353407.1 DUF1467 family protein [Salmonella enterica subsp. enterica serovar Enteritidis]ECI7685986.1 DUF1467 family protein [Salmonella enterica subsp. enterica serovar Paratyphi A]EFG8200207.1 DUF1467 family protein [Escherichia coli]
MNWVTYAAIYFITWWITLFAMLPVGLRTQEDEQNVVPGTEPSAPAGPHMLRAMIWTTVIATVLVGAFYGVVEGLGLGMDDIPNFLPDR